MEKIILKNGSFNIVLYIDNNSFYGYKFNKDNTIEKIDKSVFNYFDFLICSNNYKYLKRLNNYDVILDNNTKLLHFFNNGSEDYDKFLKFNSKSATLYDVIKISEFGDLLEKQEKEERARRLKVFQDRLLLAKKVAIISLVGALLVQDKFNLLDDSKYLYEDGFYTLDMKDKIYKSDELSENIKNYLYNEDYFNLVSKYKNEDSFSKYDLIDCMTNINIVNYELGKDKNEKGYYIQGGNTLYIGNFNEDYSYNLDTIAHEFIHLTQNSLCEYNLLTEATAEILSNEYYDNTVINAYNIQVKNVKLLMEIVGSEAILEYVFNNNFDFIEKEVHNYLDEEEYNKFISYLYMDTDNYESVEANLDMQKFEQLLSKLYYNKYNCDMKNNEVIHALLNNNLNKNYFKESDYYIIYEGEEGSISLKEAYYYKIVSFLNQEYKEIDKETYEYLKELTIDVYPSFTSKNKYIQTIKKYITYNDYINKNYQGELIINSRLGYKVEETSVYGCIPKIIMIDNNKIK